MDANVSPTVLRNYWEITKQCNIKFSDLQPFEVVTAVQNFMHWLHLHRHYPTDDKDGLIPERLENFHIDDRYSLDAKIYLLLQITLHVSDIYMPIFRSIRLYTTYCIWCSALGVVAEVVRSRCVVLCTVCEFCIRLQNLQQCTRLHTGSSEPQLQHLVLNTIWSNIIRIESNTPEDEHIDARNM